MIGLLTLANLAADTSKSAISVVRWAENAPGCSLQEGQNGRSDYLLSTADYDVKLAVDRQELEKIPHRATPMLGVFLDFRYKGTDRLGVEPQRFTLEFVKHFQIVHHSLRPEKILNQIQRNIEDITDETERHKVKKHLERKQEAEAELQVRLKDYTEMMDFVSTHALRPTVLDTSQSGIGGWVFFAVKDKFIGSWHKPEEFILRIPIKNFVIEFPFSLPPANGTLKLRSRPQD